MAFIRAHLICLGLLVYVVAVINAGEHHYRITGAPTIHRHTHIIPGTRIKHVHRHEHHHPGSVAVSGASSDSASYPSDSGEAPPIPVPTPASEASAPETPAPETPAPAIPAPASEAPGTTPFEIFFSIPVPATEAPETPAPITEAPATEVPETPAPETSATLAPATDAPETPASETPASEIPAGEHHYRITSAPTIHRHTHIIPGTRIKHVHRHEHQHPGSVEVPGANSGEAPPKQVPENNTPDDVSGVYYLINLIYNYFSAGGKLSGVPPVDLLLLRYYVAQGPKKFCSSA